MDFNHIFSKRATFGETSHAARRKQDEAAKAKIDEINRARKALYAEMQNEMSAAIEAGAESTDLETIEAKYRALIEAL